MRITYDKTVDALKKSEKRTLEEWLLGSIYLPCPLSHKRICLNESSTYTAAANGYLAAACAAGAAHGQCPQRTKKSAREANFFVLGISPLAKP